VHRQYEGLSKITYSSGGIFDISILSAGPESPSMVCVNVACQSGVVAENEG